MKNEPRDRGQEPAEPPRTWPIGRWSLAGAAIVLVVAVAVAVFGLSAGARFGSSEKPVRAQRPVVEDSAADPLPPPMRDPPGPAPEGMVWIPGGTFRMGSDDVEFADASPVHEVTLDGFWIDRTEVTNKQFARFVSATGYVTVAERKPDPKDFPGAPLENLVAGSLVFSPPAGAVSLDEPLSWWKYVPGADWRHPEGTASHIDGRDDYPVVQVCWDDAAAYARWAKKRLPTEAEWEYAARGGLDRKQFCWGDELRPGGKWMVNNWQGRFPTENTAEDGFPRTAPVGSFPPNGYGLCDMAGNVWEWCADWYRPLYDDRGVNRNPKGPFSSFDPNEAGVPKRVQRGGSFLCSDLYCKRYRPGARGKGAPDSGAPHVGFRCVRSPAESGP